MSANATQVDARSDDVILRTAGLSKSFAGFVAVDGVDLAVRRHRIHSLIGPNGAGKTTCFNLLTKFLAPSKGQIFFKGTDITGWGPAEVARHGLCRTFQISAVFPHLSVRENVRLALQVKHGRSLRFWQSRRSLAAFDDRADAVLEAVGLLESGDTPASELSYGRKRTLELATTLALEPELMLLDEPLAGVGREDVERICAVILEAAQKSTVLMVEHNLSAVAKLSDTITVLARGQVLAEGDYRTVSEHPLVVAAYIGHARA
jgi:branched-chain amino acid transport system ATP-binding protein